VPDDEFESDPNSLSSFAGTSLAVSFTVKFRAVLRKGIVRQGLERDATVTAAKLAQQRPGAEGRSLARHLNRVQLALRRMRYRDYGLCAACGRPISDARLRLMPTAGTCTACQKRLDAEARGEQR
jgi:hypothetical protein